MVFAILYHHDLAAPSYNISVCSLASRYRQRRQRQQMLLSTKSSLARPRLWAQTYRGVSNYQFSPKSMSKRPCHPRPPESWRPQIFAFAQAAGNRQFLGPRILSDPGNGSLNHAIHNLGFVKLGCFAYFSKRRTLKKFCGKQFRCMQAGWRVLS